MTFFRFAAYLAPLLAGLGVAAALAWTEGRPLKTRLAWAVSGVAALLLPLLPLGRAFAGAAALAGALALLVAAVYLCARGARVPAGAAQVVASLVPVVLYGLVFLFEPVFEHAARTGMSEDALGRRITLGLELSPIAVTTISILGDDFYHRPTFYRLDFAAYKHAQPAWTGAVAMYLGAAAVFAALAAGLHALRKKPA